MQSSGMLIDRPPGGTSVAHSWSKVLVCWFPWLFCYILGSYVTCLLPPLATLLYIVALSTSPAVPSSRTPNSPRHCPSSGPSGWLTSVFACNFPATIPFCNISFFNLFLLLLWFSGPSIFLWLYLIPIYFSICFLSCSFPYSAWHYRAIVELLIWDACEYRLKTINLHLALCQYVIIIYTELAWQNSKIPVTTLSQILENNS